MPILEIQYLNAHIRKTATGCWEWTGPNNGRGYGIVSFRGTRAYAHRLMYERCFETRIPNGLVVDHLCRNPSCCNPEHLEPVTQRENVLRGKKAQQTHCIHGHPFDAANTRITGAGHRQCRACCGRREADRRERRTGR